MKKIALLGLTFASAAVFSLSAPHEASAGDPCVRKEFKTKLIAEACKKGGQAEAKKVMKKQLSKLKAKSDKVKTCKSCHTSLAPKYELTADGLELYKQAGGK